MKEGIITRFLIVLLFLGMTLTDVTAQQKKYVLFESKKGRFTFQCPDTWQFEVATIETDTSEEVRDWRNGRFVSTDSTEAKYIKIAMTE
jgi:hypothetical protein